MSPPPLPLLLLHFPLRFLEVTPVSGIFSRNFLCIFSTCLSPTKPSSDLTAHTVVGLDGFLRLSYLGVLPLPWLILFLKSGPA